jgi:hypothetical protein
LCLLSDTNGKGTYEFRMGRREAQSQVPKDIQPTAKEINERVREEIMSFSRIRFALDRLYLRAVHTQF